MADPYIYTADIEITVPFQGETIHLKPGDTREFQDPCTALAFVNAVDSIYAVTAGGTRDETDPGFDAMREFCSNQGGDPGTNVVPVTPSPNPDPSTTDSGNPSDHEDESAQNLNPPSPQTNGDVQGGQRAPDESDGRSLAQQYYDKNNPMPDYDVRDQLDKQGVPGDQQDGALQKVIHNEPEKGKPHPDFGKDNRKVLDTVVDPVLLFTGQYSQTIVDVEIASRGFPLRLIRMYRSAPVFFGPWGYNWDHNYNVYLRPLDNGGVVIWTGQCVEEVYMPKAGGAFETPTGGVRKLEWQLATATHPDRYVLTERQGLQLIFEWPINWPLEDRWPLTRIEDRYGNVQLVTYNVEGKVSRVSDHAGRYIEFLYGDCGLLEHVRDHTNRTWHYIHDDDIEHLVRIVTPPTQDYPTGLTTSYEYDRYRDHPLLVHNLIRVIDGAGATVVENTYGSEPGTDDFGRIIAQMYGDSETTFAAAQLQYVPRTPEAVNVPALRVEVIDPGVLRIYTFNYRGDLLDDRYRLVYDGTYRLVARTFRYDKQGNMIEERDPDGHGYLYVYDHENDDPRARGNLLSVTEVASPLEPAISRDLLQIVYEPRYQEPKQVTSVTKARTEFIYDYERSPLGVGMGLLLEMRHPKYTQPDGTIKQGIEQFHYNAAGQLLQHNVAGATHTFTYATAGFTNGYLLEHNHTGAGTTVSEQFRYDDVGNLIARIDGEGNQTTYTVNALGKVERVDVQDGASWQFHYDANNRVASILEPRGAYDDAVLAGDPIRHDYFYNSLGYLIKEVQAANTITPRTYHNTYDANGKLLERIDPLGRRFRRVLDERDQPLREELWDNDESLVYRHLYRYSRFGQLIEEQLEGGPLLKLSYNGFHELKAVTSPDGTYLTYQRDAHGLLGMTEIHAGEHGPLLAQRRWEHDERGLIQRQIESLFTDPAGPFQDVTTSFWLDELGRLERIDEPGGLVRYRMYSPLDALLEERDSLGNRVTWHVDKAGRTTQLEIEEAQNGTTKLYAWTQSYDARGRIRSAADPLGNMTRYEYDARGLLTRAFNPLNEIFECNYDASGLLTSYAVNGITMRYERDAGGRVIRLTDPAGTVTQYEHDAQDRLTRVRKADGRDQQYQYDITGAVLRFIDFDGTRIEYENSPLGQPLRITPFPASGLAATQPVEFSYNGLGHLTQAKTSNITQTFSYDSLGRLLREDGPNIIEMAYDPAGRLQKLTYPDKRQNESSYDELGRLLHTNLTVEGDLPLSAHGLTTSAQLLGCMWAGQNRLAALQMGQALTCTYEYDGAARLSTSHYQTSTGEDVCNEAYVRDALGLRRADRVVAPQAHSNAYAFDALTRLQQARLDMGGHLVPEHPGTLTQAEMNTIIQNALTTGGNARIDDLSYHNSDTLASRIERAADGTVLLNKTFTSNTLNQVTSVNGQPLTYDAAGNLVDDGSATYVYDAFRRLTEVQRNGTTITRFTYDGLGRLHTRSDAVQDLQHFAYLRDEIIQISDQNGVLLQYTPGVQLDQPALVSTRNASYLLAYDGMHSLVAACSPAGSIQERYHYDLFGLPQTFAPDGITSRPAPTLGFAPSYQGHPYVQSCGLYNARDRFYHPDLYIYLQTDPLGLIDSWSPYTFDRYNPLNYSDPYGEWIHILIGAVVGAAIGGIGAALSGGSAKDILMGIGSGAVGGAITAATGNPALGAAVAGGMMGSWSGYKIGGATGAVVGGVLGTGIGAASGFIGGRIGNAIATRAHAFIYRTLTQRAVSVGTKVIASRYGSMVIGGYAGGASAGIFGNNAATVAVDVATGQPIASHQLWDATKHGLGIDGALGAVGAAADRFNLVREQPGNFSNKVGAEGEELVGQANKYERTQGRESVTVNGRQRRPDFPTRETLDEHNAVLEVKNKDELSQRDIDQIRDFATFAAQQSPGGEVIVFERPGADLARPIPGANNVRWRPIPQKPLVIAVPVPEQAKSHK